MPCISTVGLFVCMHLGSYLTMSPFNLFLLRFAVCDQCILIEDNIKKAGKNIHEREVWQKAKKIHREYVRKSACGIPKKNKLITNKACGYFTLFILLCRSSCSVGCTCTAAPIAHTTRIACIPRLMGPIKLHLAFLISIRMINVRQKGWNTRSA